MKYVFLKCAVLFIILFSNVSYAKSNNSYNLKTFELKGSRYFSNYNSVVGKYLRQKSPNRHTRACIVGIRIDGQNNQAWVIWRGGDNLILWEGGGDNDLDRSRRNLSLSQDVVRSDAEIGTSTYLVSRPWVTALERKCAQKGRYVAVN
jgi:hypothetical protein